MSSLLRTRRLVLFGIIALMLPLLAACTGDDGDDNDVDTASDTTPVATSAADDTTPEVDTTPDADGSPTAAETPDATPETDGTVEATGTADMASTPETTGTPDSTPDAVGTPDGTPDTDGTPGTGSVDDPFADVAELATEVPNFTLEFTGTFTNVPDDTGETFSTDMEMMLEQSEPDVYHLRLVTTDDEALEIEVWSLPDATHISESGGEPVELPAGMAAEIAPAEALMVIPPVEALENAEEVGQEDINSRSTTHYRVDAEQAALILLSQGVTVTNPEGGMDIWIDDELEIILQMTADLTFENEDGSEGSIELEYMVTDIDETGDIEAP